MVVSHLMIYSEADEPVSSWFVYDIQYEIIHRTALIGLRIFLDTISKNLNVFTWLNMYWAAGRD